MSQHRAAVTGAAGAPPQQEMSGDADDEQAAKPASTVRRSKGLVSSWTRKDDKESNAMALTSDRDYPDVGSQTTTRKRRLSLLEKVLQHCPVESEAEAHVMSALEEMDPTIQDDEAQEESKQQTIILGESCDALDAAAAAKFTTKTTDALPLVSDGGPPSTAEDLSRLTHELQEQHNEYLTSSTKLEVQQQDIPEATTSAEALAQNAANVVNRMKSTRNLEQQQQEGTETKPKTEPSRRVLFDSEGKKSDTQSRNDDDNDEEMNAPLSSPTGNDVKIFKTHEVLMSQFSSLKAFLAGKRAGFIKYVKVAMLYIIIPATLVAVLLFYVFGNRKRVGQSS
jgi:hypothetical protein